MSRRDTNSLLRIVIQYVLILTGAFLIPKYAVAEPPMVTADTNKIDILVLLDSQHGLMQMSLEQKSIYDKIKQNPEQYLPTITKIIAEKVKKEEYESAVCGVALMGELGDSGRSNVVDIIMNIHCKMNEQKETKEEIARLRDFETISFGALNGVYNERAVDMALDAVLKRDAMHLAAVKNYLIVTDSDKVGARIKMRLNANDITDQAKKVLIDIRDEVMKRKSSLISSTNEVIVSSNKVEEVKSEPKPADKSQKSP